MEGKKMWLIMAILSAFFAGITSILAKCGIKKTDSDVVTALRTVVVLLFSWIMVFVVDLTISDFVWFSNRGIMDMLF